MDLIIDTPRVFLPLFSGHRYVGIKGGRASGKSHALADYWLEDNIASKQDWVCIRENQKSLQQSVKKLLESKISKYNAGDYFEVQDKRIFSKNGGVTIFEGMQAHTAESIKSLEGFNRAWVEEAQTLSQKSLDMLRPTIRAPKSQLLFTWNPRQPDDAVDQFFLGGEPPPDSVLITANYMDNPWLPDEMTLEMEYDKGRDYAKYRHIWLGEYLQRSDSQVLTNWHVQEFEAPDDAVIRQGADWGYSIDPSTLVRCYINGKKLYVDYEAYQVGCPIDYLPDLFAQIPNSNRWPITADSARPETINYMRTHGYPHIYPAVKGAKSLQEGVAFLQSFDIIVHPRCTHLIDELMHYRYKIDPQTDRVLPQLQDKDNHLIDALRYACEGVRRAAKQTHSGSEKKTVRPAGRAMGWMG